MQKVSDEIINKMLSGAASKEEVAEAVRWFATEEGSRFLSEQIDNDFQEIERAPAEILVPHAIPSAEMRDTILQRTSAKKNTSRSLAMWRVAAVLLPLVMLIGFGVYVNRHADIFGTSGEQVLEVARGEKLKFVFQDGSNVLVNSETRLQFPTRFGLKNRTVQLQGEAYFDVAGMKKRPFTVQLENARITVLGTRFNVKAYPEDDSIRISLDEGSIAFQNDLQHSQTLLKPGQSLAFDKKTGASRLYSEANNNAWTENRIVFKNTPFADIVKSIERAYNVTFHIKNADALHYAFTFTSTPNVPLENILEDFERVSPLKFHINANTVTVWVE
ncbi:MAG: FecR domain-containing protein [Bacteroidia bacterium]|nr:FecR domain-containing protein [Bacteroidia bacterium]